MDVHHTRFDFRDGVQFLLHQGEGLPVVDVGRGAAQRPGGVHVARGMVAGGESIIENAEVVRRGYENLEERLSALGASIKKIE